jgi:predicted signal transduction protein with EAL and GGDEF domain
LFNRADSALYDAKQSGKNAVRTAVINSKPIVEVMNA